MPAANKAIVKSLCSFLGTNMGSVEKTYDHFPNPTQSLVYPALTVSIRTMEYRPLQSYVISKTELSEDADEAEVTVRRAVGRYNYSLQIDLWSSYKAQRDQLVEELIQAFNKNSNVQGISLQLADYYNEWAHYIVDGNPQYLDAEEGSQRNEWRALIPVSVNCRSVIESLEYVIVEVENNLETPDEIEPPEAQDSGFII